MTAAEPTLCTVNLDKLGEPGLDEYEYPTYYRRSYRRPRNRSQKVTDSNVEGKDKKGMIVLRDEGELKSEDTTPVYAQETSLDFSWPNALVLLQVPIEALQLFGLALFLLPEQVSHIHVTLV